MSVGQAVGRVAGYLGIALQEQRPVRSKLARRGARRSAEGTRGHWGAGATPQSVSGPISPWDAGLAAHSQLWVLCGDTKGLLPRPTLI